MTGGFPATWSRKDEDLILSFARKRLKGRGGYMKWRVSAEAYSGGGEDWAPDEGWFRFAWQN